MASIRCVRPDFTTSANSAAFASSDAARWRERRDQVGDDGLGRGDVDRRRELVVGRQRVVHVVVRVDRTSPPSRSAARRASTSLAFMFDEVPEPVWNDVDRELGVPVAAGHLGRGGRDGVGLGRIEQAALGPNPRAGALDQRQGGDQLALDRLPGDREVLDRPLGLGPPLGLARHLAPRP